MAQVGQAGSCWAFSAPDKVAHGELTGVVLSQRVSALPFHWFLHHTACVRTHLQEGSHVKSKRELEHADVFVSVQPFCDSDESEGCERVFFSSSSPQWDPSSLYGDFEALSIGNTVTSSK